MQSPNTCMCRVSREQCNIKRSGLLPECRQWYGIGNYPAVTFNILDLVWVIDEYRSRLNEKSIEALICGGDWLRNKYGLKKKQKVFEAEEEEEIILKI
ncbi:hypothetical protein K1719_021272 [Acacia pycnantha]|nr:hypothetical protein K1719_021272 [Acacia pycnantha]